MSAYLYYVMASPVLSDGDYDELSKQVVAGWDQIDPIRQWQLGSKEDIAASGFQVKVTWLTVDAAHSWAGLRVECPLQNWKWSEEHRVRYSGLI